MENEEVIRENMARTRESLTDKLETLEQKLVDSVQEAKSAVTETVASVKETMHEGVETVKDAVDIPAHVERRPWLMVGGSILCGYILGVMLERRREPAPAPAFMPPSPSPRPQAAASHGQPGNGHSKHRKAEALPPAPAPKENTWLSAIEPEVRHLKGLALGVALGTVREMITGEVPPHLADKLRGVIDGVTEKLGGEPLPASDFEFARSQSKASASEGTGGVLDPEQPRW